MSSEQPASKEPRFAVKVKLDGKIMPMKGFIHDILGGAVYGMIENLKGYEDSDSIEIEVSRRTLRRPTDAKS